MILLDVSIDLGALGCDPRPGLLVIQRSSECRRLES
jgi:hypothetical protein